MEMRKNKMGGKIISMIMAVLMLVSVAAVPVPAAAAETGQRYDYEVYVINQHTIYTDSPALIYVRTENPDPMNIHIESTMLNTAYTMRPYADAGKACEQSYTDIVPVRDGYIYNLGSETAGQCTAAVYEFKEEFMDSFSRYNNVNYTAYNTGETVSFEIKDYDEARAAWSRTVLEEVTDDSMTDVEKMDALLEYVEKNFKYHTNDGDYRVYLIPKMGAYWEVYEGDCLTFTGMMLDFAEILGLPGEKTYAGYANHHYATVTSDGEEHVYDAEIFSSRNEVDPAAIEDFDFTQYQPNPEEEKQDPEAPQTPAEPAEPENPTEPEDPTPSQPEAPAEPERTPEEDARERLFASRDINRVYGANRYTTSIQSADALKASMNVQKFDNIIVACGTNYPDALSGSYLAKVKNAPVMLVGEDIFTENSVRQYIKNNLKTGGKVYILGASGVVTSRFEKSLKNHGIKVSRLAGPNRYDTNLAILNEAGTNGEKELLVCTGNGFADSLSASAVGKPILLVNGNKLTAAQARYVSSFDPDKIYLIGGESVVSRQMANSLKKYAAVERVSGVNRFKTSEAVANRFFPGGSAAVVMAYAHNFPDGLSGGPLAMSIGAPLMLADNSNYKEVKNFVRKSGTEQAVTLGGPSLISDRTVNTIMK